MKSPVLLFIMSLFAIGCSNHFEHNDHRQQTLFVSGNPMQLIQHTLGNSKSFLNAQNVESFAQDYEVFYTKRFFNKYVLSNRHPSELPLAIRKPPNNFFSNFLAETPERKLILSNEIKGTTTLTADINKTTKWKFTLQQQANGRVNFVAVDGIPIEVLHYSQSKDASNYSILFSIDIDRQHNGKAIKTKGLYYYLFTQKYNRKAIKQDTASAYNYLFGTGVKFKWQTKHPIKINLCTHQMGARKKEILQGINLWTAHTKNLVDFEIVEKQVCPPFSDLQSNNITFVKDLYAASEKDKLGTTLIAPNINKKLLVNGNIVLFDKALSGSPTPNIYKVVAAHEFGHLLGLHHMKSKTTPSIMSYAKVAKIYQYDINALKDLYAAP